MPSDVISSAEFVRRLKEEISRSPKQRVDHPFVRAVCAGTASMEQILKMTEGCAAKVGGSIWRS